ncbi:hypothetical protein GIB67_041821 [Kingdonia uniflora]|uniref:Uncharacterized protein n=1 Tax=Kingdonia uniflora TaxID=39325 RepID=A0A7J7L5V7_9MAGN|nr:hypothetical protein GIB67_041821 [Kingdonia uniflora]
MASKRCLLLWCFGFVVATFTVGALFFTGFHRETSLSLISDQNVTVSSSANRKLLEEHVDQPSRIWGDRCSKADIVVNQGPTSPLPNGIPTYTVEIMNVCSNGCDISGIHLSCGWFSSARLINPRVFKRLRYNDCIVNDGKALVNGGTLSFQYANTYRYPLAVATIIC